MTTEIGIAVLWVVVIIVIVYMRNIERLLRQLSKEVCDLKESLERKEEKATNGKITAFLCDVGFWIEPKLMMQVAKENNFDLENDFVTPYKIEGSLIRIMDYVSGLDIGYSHNLRPFPFFDLIDGTPLLQCCRFKDEFLDVRYPEVYCNVRIKEEHLFEVRFENGNLEFLAFDISQESHFSGTPYYHHRRCLGRFPYTAFMRDLTKIYKSDTQTTIERTEITKEPLVQGWQLEEVREPLPFDTRAESPFEVFRFHNEYAHMWIDFKPFKGQSSESR